MIDGAVNRVHWVSITDPYRVGRFLDCRVAGGDANVFCNAPRRLYRIAVRERLGEVALLQPLLELRNGVPLHVAQARSAAVVGEAGFIAGARRLCARKADERLVLVEAARLRVDLRERPRRTLDVRAGTV